MIQGPVTVELPKTLFVAAEDLRNGRFPGAEELIAIVANLGCRELLVGKYAEIGFVPAKFLPCFIGA
jgi:hypothetical protein